MPPSEPRPRLPRSWPDPINVRCPVCETMPGIKCCTVLGFTRHPHRERIELAKEDHHA